MNVSSDYRTPSQMTTDLILYGGEGEKEGEKEGGREGERIGGGERGKERGKGGREKRVT